MVLKKGLTEAGALSGPPKSTGEAAKDGCTLTSIVLDEQHWPGLQKTFCLGAHHHISFINIETYICCVGCV